MEALGREAADWARLEHGLKEWIAKHNEGNAVHSVSPYGTFFWLAEQENREPLQGILEDRYWLSLGANRSQMEALRAVWDLKPGKKLACGKGQVYRFRKALCYFENEPQPWESVSVLSEESSSDPLITRYLTRGWHHLTWKIVDDKAAQAQPWSWQSVHGSHRVHPQKPGWNSPIVKPIKELLAQKGVGEVLRRDWPVLCYQNRVVWVPLVHGSEAVQAHHQDLDLVWPFHRLQWTWLGPSDLLSSHDPRPGNG